jgi:hypothetical protein
MSEESSAGGAPIEASGDHSQDTVKYETYKKAVGEAKKAKEMLSQLQAEKESQAAQTLAEQNKWKELYEKTQKDLLSTKEDLKKKDAFFIQNNLKSTVARYAKDLGAIDQAVDEIYEVAKSKGLLNSIEVKEDYSVNADHVKNSLGELAKSSPWFFQKTAKNINDVVVGPKGVKTESDYKTMPKDKLLEAYKEMLQKR